jgi:hypothetical protein
MAVCAACEQVNPEIARFCLACGAPIELTPGPVAEERKTVTAREIFASLGATPALTETDKCLARATALTG